MKKVIFTFVYLTSKFETFAEILFHEIYIACSGNFRGNFFLQFMPKFAQATKIISVPSRYVFLSQIFSYFL